MKKSFKSLLFGLPLVCLAACSNEEPITTEETPVDNNGNSQIADKTEVRYLRINLVNSGSQQGSRADDPLAPDNAYSNGTAEENKIRTLNFFFYDADKNFHSTVAVPLDKEIDPTTPSADSWVDSFFETNVPVNLVQGEKLPTYVLCVVNGVIPTAHRGKSMAEAQEYLLNDFYSTEGGGKKYLAMNNSVYYGRDEVTGQDNQLIMATPFDTNKLRTETELAGMKDDELKNFIINIYVERYAAKVNFNVAADAVLPVEAANGGTTLTFEQKGWNLNAYEDKFYFVKSFRASGENTPASSFSTIDELNGLLFPGWNRPEHFRSFWSRTPGYYENDYPLVADDILDKEKDDYTVNYTSFKEATQEPNTSKYVIETTLKGSRLTGEDMGDQYLPLTSIPSVVLTGQYKVKTPTDTEGSYKTFYTYQKDPAGKPYVYAANAGDLGSDIETIHDRLLRAQIIVLKKVGEGETARYVPVQKSDIASSAKPFVVKHPEKDVRTGLKLGGDYVTLQVNGVNTGYFYYDTDTREFLPINTPSNVSKVNRLLYQNLGGAHQYTNGMAFFSAPIQHWGWYREGNKANHDKAMADWDWSIMKTGDFGIVRNHIYTLEISKIAGLGTGIINDTDPLLPPTDKVSYAVHFHVNIQKWATLPVQKWDW